MDLWETEKYTETGKYYTTICKSIKNIQRVMTNLDLYKH